MPTAPLEPAPRFLSVPIRLVVWGLTGADADQAISEAKQGWGRQTWDVVEIARHVGGKCPVKVNDPSAIAAAQHYGRAYAAYGRRSQ